jgi:hypothetical protein
MDMDFCPSNLLRACFDVLLILNPLWYYTTVIRYRYLSHALELPILLSSEVSPYVIGAALAAPVMIFTLCKALFFDSYFKYKQNKYVGFLYIILIYEHSV